MVMDTIDISHSIVSALLISYSLLNYLMP